MLLFPNSKVCGGIRRIEVPEKEEHTQCETFEKAQQLLVRLVTESIMWPELLVFLRMSIETFNELLRKSRLQLYVNTNPESRRAICWSLDSTEIMFVSQFRKVRLSCLLSHLEPSSCSLCFCAWVNFKSQNISSSHVDQVCPYQGRKRLRGDQTRRSAEFWEEKRKKCEEQPITDSVPTFCCWSVKIK